MIITVIDKCYFYKFILYPAPVDSLNTNNLLTLVGMFLWTITTSAKNKIKKRRKMKNKTACFFPYNSYTLNHLFHFVLMFITFKVVNMFVLFLTLKGTWALLIFLFNYISFFCFLSLLVYSIALYKPQGFYWLMLGYSGPIFLFVCLSFMCVPKYKRVDNHQSITIVLILIRLDCKWGFWKQK